jgi:hypothetical protein
MTDNARLRVTPRPLADRERADLERQAQDSERLLLHHWARALHRWALIGCGALAVLAALWWATVHWDLDRRKSALAVAGGGLAFLAISAFELYEARARVKAMRAGWAGAIEQASAQPVVEIQLRPARAWGSPEDGWMFDISGGRALFADWDLPLGAATEIILAAVSPAGGVWFDQSGEEIRAAPLPYSWEDLRDDHPLLDLTGPVTFRLDSDPGAALRDFFEPEWLVPPARRDS